jgi:hypothetical protein
MKFALLSFFLCAQAFSAITPDEKREALGQTREVMMKIIGEGRHDSRIITARVTDEFGTRLNVEFAFARDFDGAKKCSYSYDRVLKRVLVDSWTCEI